MPHVLRSSLPKPIPESGELAEQHGFTATCKQSRASSADVDFALWVFLAAFLMSIGSTLVLFVMIVAMLFDW